MRGRGVRGQALVEAALIFPLLMVFLLGAIDFGRAFTAALQAGNSARQAAGYAAQHQADGQSNGGSCQSRWGQTIDVAIASGPGLGLGCSSVSVSSGSADPFGRSPVTVTVNVPFQPFTPLAGQVLGLNKVSGSATARGETW